jgi:hypothetical protein
MIKEPRSAGEGSDRKWGDGRNDGTREGIYRIQYCQKAKREQRWRYLEEIGSEVAPTSYHFIPSFSLIHSVSAPQRLRLRLRLEPGSG